MQIPNTSPIVYALLVAILAWVAQPVLANEDDRFWDASGTAGRVSMKAKYKESPENNLIDQTLEVQIEDAPANIGVFVYLNGRKIGKMTTDMFGTGRFRLDQLGVEPGPDGRPTGARINDGDQISVGRGSQRVSGTFQERQ